MKFKGSIVITDPCYILKDEDWTDGYYMPGLQTIFVEVLSMETGLV